MSTDNSIDQSNKSKSTHPFQVKKLANLEQRLARWEAQKKQNRKEMLTKALIVFPIVFLLMFGVAYLNNVAFDLYQIGLSVIVSVTMMIPLIINQQVQHYSRMPTQADVDADIELRKYFEMDSKVND